MTYPTSRTSDTVPTAGADFSFHTQAAWAAAPSARTGMAVIGANRPSHEPLSVALDACGVGYKRFASASALANYDGQRALGLAVVTGQPPVDSTTYLLDSLRSMGIIRTVLVGPSVESAQYPFALNCGFDEVWPTNLPTQTFKALLKKSWQTTLQVSGTVPDKAPSLGPVSLNPESCSATVEGSVAYLSRSCFVLLQSLVSKYPYVASRSDLLMALGKLVPGLDGRSRAVDMAIHRLRKQLAQAGVQAIAIRSVEQMGYRLNLGAHPLQ